MKFLKIHTKLLLFTTSAFLSVYLMMCACNTSGKLSEKVIDSTDVLLVATGFSSLEQNLNLDSVEILATQNRVYFIKKDSVLVKHFFKKEFAKLKGINSSDDFQKLANGNYLISSIDNADGRFKNLEINSTSYFVNPEKYKLAIKGSKQQFTKFMLTGVTAITRAAGNAADNNGYEFLIEKVKPYFLDADLVHISNEVSILQDCQFIKGTRFCSKEAHFSALLDLSCDIVELTGNHNKDFGGEAFKYTLDWYKNNNIKTFGGGNTPEDANAPLVITLKDGKKLGFIGFNEKCPINECADKAGDCGANRYNKAKAQAVISKMRKELKCDFIIASVQWQEWDEYKPHEQQKIIAKDLVDFGADFVYGSQAHQIQQVEFYKNKPIFYGLGNFLFDQIHRVGVRQAFFLEMYFHNGKLINVKPVFTFMGENRQQQIANPAEEAAMREVIYIDSLMYK